MEGKEMKHWIIVSLSTICLVLMNSSCAISSKSNAVATDTLEVKNYKEISENDKFASLTFNVPLFTYTANRHSVSVPVGLNANFTHAKYGYLNAKYENEIKVIALIEGEQNLAKNNALFSSEYNVTYCLPIINSIKTIERQELALGREDQLIYYAIMPTKILRRFGLRAGYSVQGNSFMDDGYQVYIEDTYNGHPSGDLDGISSQKSSEFRVGLCYQEAINTSFVGIAKGKELNSRTKNVFTVYFDLGFHLRSKFNDLSYPYVKPEFTNPNDPSFYEYVDATSRLNPSFFYSKRPLSTVLGVQSCKDLGDSFWVGVNAEVGFLSGYYGRLMNSFFIDLKFSLGIGSR